MVRIIYNRFLNRHLRMILEPLLNPFLVEQHRSASGPEISYSYSGTAAKGSPWTFATSFFLYQR